MSQWAFRGRRKNWGRWLLVIGSAFPVCRDLVGRLFGRPGFAWNCIRSSGCHVGGRAEV